jgi:hypothetical protein
MGNFTNINRKVGAAVGAIVISMAFLTAAIGPAASANDFRGDGYAAAQGQVSVQEKQA